MGRDGREENRNVLHLWLFRFLFNLTAKIYEYTHLKGQWCTLVVCSNGTMKGFGCCPISNQALVLHPSLALPLN